MNSKLFFSLATFALLATPVSAMELNVEKAPKLTAEILDIENSYAANSLGDKNDFVLKKFPSYGKFAPENHLVDSMFQSAPASAIELDKGTFDNVTRAEILDF